MVSRALTLFLIATIATAQTPLTAARIEGRVLNLSGDPIPRAIVTLRRGVSSVTDDQGRFTFADVDPGRYTLSAQRAGFVGQIYGASSIDAPGMAISVTSGEKITDLMFKLVPQGVISGRVTNEDGEGAPGMRVQVTYSAYSRTGEPEQRTALANLRDGPLGQPNGGMSTTDDQGNFRIANVPPDHYFVRAERLRGAQVGTEPAVLIPGREAPEADLTTYYPSETAWSDAKAVELTAGAEIRGVDIRLRRARVYSVRGRAVTEIAGLSASNQLLAISPAGDSSISGYARPGSDGKFEFRSLVPGAYIIHSSGRNPNTPGALPTLHAHAEVTIANSDVEGLSVLLTPGVDISGTVTVEGNERRPSFVLSMQPAPPDEAGQLANGPVSQSGRIGIRSVAPGRYVLQLNAVAPGVYLKTVQFGKQDALHAPLDLMGGSNPNLSIVFSARVAKITGIVRNGGAPSAGATVTVWPKVPQKGLTTGGARTAVTDQHGQFEIGDLAPGAYYAASFEDIDPALVSSADFLLHFNSEASEIKVDEGSTVSADLLLISGDRVAAEAKKC